MGTGGTESPAEPVVPPQAAHHGKPQQQNPNVRLRELLSIPERVRTDAQWDEIIDIEISIGPRKPPSNMRPQHQPAFRQNDHRGDRTDRSEKKHGGGSAGAPSGNKHMRKRNNKNASGQQGGGRPPQGSGGTGGGGGQGGRSGSE